MKCSEYLWKRIQLDTLAPDEWRSERVQAELNLAMNGEPIVSDTTGEEMSEQEANSIYGRNYEKLNKAYKENKKSLFVLIATKQQISDDEYEAAMAEEEAAAAGEAQ